MRVRLSPTGAAREGSVVVVHLILVADWASVPARMADALFIPTLVLCRLSRLEL